MKIAYFGGTFDPPHLGHLNAIKLILDQTDVDLVYVVVSNDPWMKSSVRKITDPYLRLKMAQLAFENLDRVKVSDIEITRGGKSYSIDTVKTILKNHPSARISLVVGSELLEELPAWKNFDELTQLVDLIVLCREQQPDSFVLNNFASKVFIKIDEFKDVSSSLIRELVKGGAELNSYLSKPVMDFIKTNKLYLDSK